MINLGPYSGKNCPAVHYKPTILDRILEIAVVIILLATWGSIYWLYTLKGGWMSPNAWVMGGVAIFTTIIVGLCAYAPVRSINFPVQVSERNIAVQYLLATRLTRGMNVILNLIFLVGVFMEYYGIAKILFSALFIVLALVCVVYFILAYKYK